MNLVAVGLAGVGDEPVQQLAGVATLARCGLGDEVVDVELPAGIQHVDEAEARARGHIAGLLRNIQDGVALRLLRARNRKGGEF